MSGLRMEFGRMNQNKYRAIKTVYNGVKYDSKKEAHYARELDLRLKAKDIIRYERQPIFVLQPAYKKDGRMIREIRYIADFKVFYPDGLIEIIDCKGMKTRDYLIKKKMFEYRYPNMEILER